MQRTYDRLKKGSEIYRTNSQSRINSEMRSYPTVNYPNKVERDYLQYVRNNGNGSFACVFRHITFYKKIARYQQINYHRYPVYSSTLTKEKTVEVKIKGTPTVLAGLMHSDNPLLSRNALAIVAFFPDPRIYPSWAQQEFLKLAHQSASSSLAAQSKQSQQTAADSVASAKRAYDVNVSSIKRLQLDVERLEKAVRQLLSKAINSGYHQHKILASIFSLGLRSPRRKAEGSYKKAAKADRDLWASKQKLEALLSQHAAVAKAVADAITEQNKVIARGKDKAAIEQLQYEFDLANVKQPFVDVNPPDDPTPTPYAKEKPEIQFEYAESKAPKFDRNDFLSPEDPTFAQYFGLSVVGFVLLLDPRAESFYLCMTLDVGRSISRICKKGKCKDPILREIQRNHKTIKKTELFTIRVFVCNKREDLLATFEELTSKYSAKLVLL